MGHFHLSSILFLETLQPVMFRRVPDAVPRLFRSFRLYLWIGSNLESLNGFSWNFILVILIEGIPVRYTICHQVNTTTNECDQLFNYTFRSWETIIRTYSTCKEVLCSSKGQLFISFTPGELTNFIYNYSKNETYSAHTAYVQVYSCSCVKSFYKGKVLPVLN
jgi:hypothetical protein